MITYLVEPPIMDSPNRGQPLIRDTLHGTVCILLVLFNLPPKDSPSIKDKVSAPKVSFIRRLYCISILHFSYSVTCGYIPPQITSTWYIIA